MANSSGMVGRHYMRHNCSALMAISKNPNPTVFQKTLAVNDFYFGSPDWEYPLGEIQMLGKSDGEMINAEAPAWAVWKPEFALDYLAEHSIDFWVQSEDLPDPANRVTIDSEGKIRLALELVDLEGHKRLIAKLEDMLDRHRVPRPTDVPRTLSGQGHSDRRNGSPGRHTAIWPRSEDLCAGSELQSARSG